MARLRTGDPFAFSRWGDGEWKALLGYAGATCDGQGYTKALRRALSEILLRQPTYDLGLQAFAERRHGVEIETWLARRRLQIAWTDADVFVRASQSGRLSDLLVALLGRRVVLVGPAHLAGMAAWWPGMQHVIVPSRNAFAEVDPLTAETQAALASASSPAVVAVSAGPAAKVIVDRLVRIQTPLRHTVVDFGSLWEPYVGRVTRTYHRAILDRLQVSA